MLTSAYDDQRGDRDETQLVRTALRMNALIFGALLGLLCGTLLLALAVAAGMTAFRPTRLPVFLLGVFLPGYAPGAVGGVAGFFWGCVYGGVIGAGVYWIHARAMVGHLDRAVAMERRAADFPRAALRLHGPSLGVAIGAIGALGLVGATNWLVLRGTADESVHARLLAQLLPGYDVSPLGSIVGACSLFVFLFVACIAFAWVYNRVAARSASPGATGA